MKVPQYYDDFGIGMDTKYIIHINGRWYTRRLEDNKINEIADGVVLCNRMIEYNRAVANWCSCNLRGSRPIDEMSLLGRNAEMAACLTFCPEQFGEWAQTNAIPKTHQRTGKNTGMDLHKDWTGFKKHIEVKAVGPSARHVIITKPTGMTTNTFSSAYIPDSLYVVYRQDGPIFRLIGWADKQLMTRIHNPLRGHIRREHWGVEITDLFKIEQLPDK